MPPSSSCHAGPAARGDGTRGLSRVTCIQVITCQHSLCTSKALHSTLRAESLWSGPPQARDRRHDIAKRKGSTVSALQQNLTKKRTASFWANRPRRRNPGALYGLSHSALWNCHSNRLPSRFANHPRCSKCPITFCACHRNCCTEDCVSKPVQHPRSETRAMSPILLVQ